ncbi:MAG: T9SS type A sorting domain-containing protein, partial [Crocinitomicaceae bacterium]|nr:T9SS type A sorting domain-containing protein [Crocinitomicaceae bacterium]
IHENSVTLLCDSLLLNGSDKIYPLTIDPLFTAVGPVTSAFGIRGSLLTPASCNNSLNVTFPGGSTPWDVSANWTVVTDFCARTLVLFGFYDDCYMSDAQVWITSSCGGASPVGAPATIWTCLGCNSIGTWAPTLPFASSGTQSLAQCYSPSCSNQTLTFTMFDNRSYCTSYTVYDNCTWANSYCVSLDQWSVTVQGRTIETLGNTVTGNGNTTINDGDCIGTVLLDPTPLYGVAPYSYSWSTGATSPTITVGVTPAIYTCTVTTACGSSVVATFNIGCPLSVGMSSFSAELLSNKVMLEWETLSENDISHFVVERAGSDGIFTSIAQVEAVGSQSGYKYQFKDDQPLMGISYYRLNTINHSEEGEYSEIKSIHYSSEEISIIPNPATEYVTILFDGENEIKYDLKIINSTGEIVYNQEILSEEKVISQSIGISELPAGIYTIQLSGS